MLQSLASRAPSSIFLLLGFLAAPTACTASAVSDPIARSDSTPTGGDAPVDSDAAITTDTLEDGPPSDDTKVRRLPCVDSGALASDLPSDANGELEGELVSVVPPGTAGCPADTNHLHLQILAGTKRYDVAMPISSPITTGNPVGVLEKDVTVSSLPDGWNSASFTYVGTLKVTSTDFTGLARAAMLARLEADLASAARVSIYGRAYSSGTGVHNVHFNAV